MTFTAKALVQNSMRVSNINLNILKTARTSINPDSTDPIKVLNRVFDHTESYRKLGLASEQKHTEEEDKRSYSKR